MKILACFHSVPLPLDSGRNQRNFQALHQMASRHRVTVLSFGNAGDGQLLRDHFGSTLDDIITIPKLDHVLAKGIMRAWYLTTWRSDFRRLYRPAFQKALDRTIKRIRPDLVYLSTTMLGCYRLTSAIPTLGDSHNVEYDNLERAARQANGIARRLYFNIQAKRTKREERRYDMSCGAICVPSERDALVLSSESGGRPIHVVPNGINLERYTFDRTRRDPATILFVGLMSYYPNAHGAEWFLDSVYPKVRSSIPHARVIIAGARPPTRLRRRSSVNVEVTGYVDDVRPYFARATVTIIPLHIGGGTRIKALEAMAMGVPIVSTRLGCEGLDAVDGKSVLFADSSDMFSAAVIRLLQDANLRDGLADQARKVVGEYDSRRIAEVLNRACVQAAAVKKSDAVRVGGNPITSLLSQLANLRRAARPTQT